MHLLNYIPQTFKRKIVIILYGIPEVLQINRKKITGVFVGVS